MKKLVVYAVLVLIGVYGVGSYKLNQSGVNRFLDNMLTMTNQGDVEGLCDIFASDARVVIIDHTAPAGSQADGGKMEGNRDVFCERMRLVIPALAASGASIATERVDLIVSRSPWLHPWSADVSYTEKQSTTIQAGARSMVIATESDDKLQLVMTFSGVKIKRLESEQWLQ
jgi:hypothetical protein